MADILKILYFEESGQGLLGEYQRAADLFNS